jgi:hypothetical protein
VSYKHKTLAEAYESLEEAVADLVYFGASPDAIHDAVDAEIERTVERMEP